MVKSPSRSCSRISLREISSEHMGAGQGNGPQHAGIQGPPASGDPGPSDAPGTTAWFNAIQQFPCSCSPACGSEPSGSHAPTAPRCQSHTHMSMAQHTRSRKSKRQASAKRESQIRMTSGSRNSWDSSSVSQRKAKNWGLMFCSCCGYRVSKSEHVGCWCKASGSASLT